MLLRKIHRSQNCCCSNHFHHHRRRNYNENLIMAMFIIIISTFLLMIMIGSIGSWHRLKTSSSPRQQQRRRLVYDDCRCPDDDNNHCHHSNIHPRRSNSKSIQSQISKPLEHYDFTTVCNNTTDGSSSSPWTDLKHLMISPTTTESNVPVAESILFGPLFSNNPNMFHCLHNKGVFAYTSTDFYGNKNRIENCCSTTASTSGCNRNVTNGSNSNNNNNVVNCTGDGQSTSTSSWNSIALWIQPNDITYAEQCAIITIDRSSCFSNMNHPMTTGTTATIRILQYYSSIIVVHETIQTVSNDEIETMITTTSTFLVKDHELISNQFTHLVLTVNDESKKKKNDDNDDNQYSDENETLDIQVYINGQPMFLDLERRDAITTTTTNHQRDENSAVTSTSNVPTLQLFSNHYVDDDVFLGSIYQLDIYNSIVSYDEVFSLYEHGVGYYYSGTDDDNSAAIPYYYNNEEDIFSYTATILPTTSKTQRPLMAKLSTRLDSISTPSQQIGFVVIHQIGDIHHYSNVLPNSTAIIQIQSYNQSNPIMQLGIQITSLPVYGVVRLYSSGRIISTNGTIINYNARFDNDVDREGQEAECIMQQNDIYLLFGNMTSLTVSYQLLPLNNQYYNIPTHDGYGMDLHVSPETLSYRIVEVPILIDDANTDDLYDNPSSTVAAANMMNIMKSSDMPIYVVHVHDGPPPKIVVGPYHKQQHDVGSRDNSAPTMIILNDYQVMVQDGIYVLMDGDENHNRKNHNLDYIRVDVFTFSDGTITLNPDRLILLSDAHEHCTQRYYSNWQCTVLQTKDTVHDDHVRTNIGGTGSGRSSITFVALPNDIPIILNQMVYTSHVRGQGGNITVRIYSGTDGNDCLFAKEHYWNYNITNPTSTNLSMIATTVIMEYMLLRNDTCTNAEVMVLIPNFTTDHMRTNRSSDDSKNEFLIFGFVWKEFMLGFIVLSIFLFCFCCGCKCRILPSQRLAQLLPAILRWMLGGRRSHQQFNYNDYID
jgi:hypothetical protein